MLLTGFDLRLSHNSVSTIFAGVDTLHMGGCAGYKA
jgi:hypothetical protein